MTYEAVCIIKNPKKRTEDKYISLAQMLVKKGTGVYPISVAKTNKKMQFLKDYDLIDEKDQFLLNEDELILFIQGNIEDITKIKSSSVYIGFPNVGKYIRWFRDIEDL